MEKLFAAFLLAILLAGCTQTQPPASSANASATLPDGSKLSLELARTPSEQRAGLSNRPSICLDCAISPSEMRGKLPSNGSCACGMLFIFDSDDYHAFWMKDMRFALDLIYLDSNSNIVDIIEDAHPCTAPNSSDCAIYTPSAPATYVLEVNAGYAQLHSLAKGSRIQLEYG